MSFPTAYTTCTPFTGSGAATEWTHVYNFENEFQWTCYFFGSKHAGCIWNLACALNLIIQKCDSLQTQIDALGPAEITMDAILSAMLTSDIGQIEYFVGLVDAYRVALWNKPFNAEFYAALARGFV